MTHIEKELLLKDLCARLPYGVKMNHIADDEVSPSTLIGIAKDMITLEDLGGYSCVPVEHYKPYLFPLESMTEEQWNNAPRVNLTDFTFESLKCGCFTLASYTCENNLHNLVEFINWLIENHFDVYGLIPLGLALDATNLNIY